MKKLDINEMNVIYPETLLLANNDGDLLEIEVYEDIIHINSSDKTWNIIDQNKTDFENIINPSTNRKKYIKRHIKHMFKSISKLF